MAGPIPVVRNVAVALVFVIALVGFPIHSARRHCPTAAVQTVLEAAPSGEVTIRAPREGDPEFQPCRCSARKASDAASSRETGGFAVVTFVLALPLRPDWASQAPAAETQSAAWWAFETLPVGPDQAPPTPPPNLG